MFMNSTVVSRLISARGLCRNTSSHRGGIYVKELRLEKAEKGDNRTKILEKKWIVMAFKLLGRLMGSFVCLEI